jgi:hypothetical protein
MARLFVEGWDPEYGSPFESDDGLAPAESTIDTSVEADEWAPIQGVDDGITDIAFVDGVRRIDARVTIDDPTLGPVPGICGTLAVGATHWDREARRSEVRDVRIERMAVFGNGREEVFPEVGFQPQYSTESIPDADPDRLVRQLHNRMRRLEGETAAGLARDGCFVVADGPLNDLAPQSTIGYIKSHRVTYLPPEQGVVIAALKAGQRTPLFTLSEYQRYSWYLRLAQLDGGHSWTGIVRCEASGGLPLEQVKKVADRTAAILPLVASEAHKDPRAPQNLVPIGALESELRRRMGDPALVNRGLRAAVMKESA